MSDRVFIDTNVLIYSISTETDKRDRAREAVDDAEELVTSAQVLSEFVSVCLRKTLLAPYQVEESIEAFIQVYEVIPVEAETIRRALSLQRQYRASWWDSVILAAALRANCSTILTEDLQGGQLFEGSLRVVNPFSVS